MRIAVHVGVLTRRVGRGARVLRAIVTVIDRARVDMSVIGRSIGAARLSATVIPMRIVRVRTCEARLLFAMQLIAANRFETVVLLAHRIVHRRRSTAMRVDRMKVVATTENFLTAVATAVQMTMTMPIGTDGPDIGAAADEHDIGIERGRDIDVVRFGHDLLLHRGTHDDRRRWWRRRNHDHGPGRRGRRLSDDARRCGHTTREPHCTRGARDKRRPSRMFQIVPPRPHKIFSGLTAQALES